MSLANIEGEWIVIRVPFSALPGSAQVAWDEEYGFEEHNFLVEDEKVFATELVYYLNQEMEDGTTVIHEALDKAVIEATEQGAEGIAGGDE